LVVALLVLALCSADASAQQPAAERRSAAAADTSYRDLTDKEDCILNYVRSYADRNIDRFSELFQDGCEFAYVMEPPDSSVIGSLAPRLRVTDLKSELSATKGLFAAAHELRLAIDTGTWARVDTHDGVECTDCWQTVRRYSVSMAFGVPEENESADAIRSNGHMTFIVSEIAGRWKILKYIDKPEKTERGS